jgi:hypothetical protein
VLSSDDDDHDDVNKSDRPASSPSPPPHLPGSLSCEERQQEQLPALTESSTTVPDTTSVESGENAGASSEYPSDDDGILSLDLMAWLDNFDWAQESLLNYS